MSVSWPAAPDRANAAANDRNRRVPPGPEATRRHPGLDAGRGPRRELDRAGAEPVPPTRKLDAGDGGRRSGRGVQSARLLNIAAQDVAKCVGEFGFRVECRVGMAPADNAVGPDQHGAFGGDAAVLCPGQPRVVEVAVDVADAYRIDGQLAGAGKIFGCGAPVLA